LVLGAVCVWCAATARKIPKLKIPAPTHTHTSSVEHQAL
jgi:hypothetical protein